jgi:(2Fe-2S) ferredoxin
LPYLESELADRGVDALVSSTSCLKLCDNGPALVVYPQGDWYGGVDEEAIDAILDALTGGTRAEDYLL